MDGTDFVRQFHVATISRAADGPALTHEPDGIGQFGRFGKWGEGRGVLEEFALRRLRLFQQTRVLCSIEEKRAAVARVDDAAKIQAGELTLVGSALLRAAFSGAL